METSQKIDFYFNVLNRLDQYIQLADSKASIHQAVLASMLTAVTALFSWGISLKHSNAITGYFSDTQTLMIIVYIAFITLSILWYSAINKVIGPNLNSVRQGETIDNYISTIYFNDINSFATNKDFKDKAIGLSDEAVLEDLLIQIHIISDIVSTKYSSYLKINKWLNLVVITALVLIVTVIKIKSEAV